MVTDNATKEFDLIDQQNFESFENQPHLISNSKQNYKQDEKEIKTNNNNNQNQDQKPRKPKI